MGAEQRSRPACRRAPARSDVETSSTDRGWAQLARGAPSAARGVSPRTPASALYKTCAGPRLTSVRHKERQGWVGQIVSRGRVTKPYGYEIRSDAVVSFGHFYQFPIDL